MSKVFRITPKRTKRVNGQVITPEMVITVTTRQHCLNPFYNGAVEVQEQYMRMYQFDYKSTFFRKNNFRLRLCHRMAGVRFYFAANNKMRRYD